MVADLFGTSMELSVEDVNDSRGFKGRVVSAIDSLGVVCTFPGLNPCLWAVSPPHYPTHHQSSFYHSDSEFQRHLRQHEVDAKEEPIVMPPKLLWPSFILAAFLASSAPSTSSSSASSGANGCKRSKGETNLAIATLLIIIGRPVPPLPPAHCTITAFSLFRPISASDSHPCFINILEMCKYASIRRNVRVGTS